MQCGPQHPAPPSHTAHPYAVRYAPPSHTAYACAVQNAPVRSTVAHRAPIRYAVHSVTPHCHTPRIRTQSGTPQHAPSSRTAYLYAVRPAAPRPAVTRRACARGPGRSGVTRRVHIRAMGRSQAWQQRGWPVRAPTGSMHGPSDADRTQRSRDDHATFCGGRSATRFGSLPIGPAACAPPRSPTSAKNSIAASLYHSHCAGRSSS